MGGVGMGDVKRCQSCKVVLPDEDFHTFSKPASNWRVRYCLNCARKHMKMWEATVALGAEKLQQVAARCR